MFTEDSEFRGGSVETAIADPLLVVWEFPAFSVSDQEGSDDAVKLLARGKIKRIVEKTELIEDQSPGKAKFALNHGEPVEPWSGLSTSPGVYFAFKYSEVLSPRLAVVLPFQFFNQCPDFLNVENPHLPHFDQKLKIFRPASHSFAYRDIRWRQADTSNIAGILIANFNAPIPPARRKRRSSGRNSVRIVTKCLVECADLADCSVNDD